MKLTVLKKRKRDTVNEQCFVTSWAVRFLGTGFQPASSEKHRCYNKSGDFEEDSNIHT